MKLDHCLALKRLTNSGMRLCSRCDKQSLHREAGLLESKPRKCRNESWYPNQKSNETKNEQIEKLMATGYRANIRRHFAANMMACLSDEKKAELTAIVSDKQIIDVQPERRTRKKAS